MHGLASELQPECLLEKVYWTKHIPFSAESEMKTSVTSGQLVEELELKLMKLTEGGKGPFGRVNIDSRLSEDPYTQVPFL